MTRREIVNFFLLNSKMSLVDLSDSINVNRSNVYLWKDGKTNPKTEYINKMAEVLGYKIEWHNIDNIKIIEESMPNEKDKIQDMEKIIRTQDTSIKLLEEKIKLLESSISKLKDVPFRIKTDLGKSSVLEYDYKVDLDKQSAQVRFRSISNIDLLKNNLGYSEQKLKSIFGLNEYYEYSKHPIHQLRDEKDVKFMLEKANKMMSNMAVSGDMLTKYEVELPIIYKHKDGNNVYAINSYIINTETQTGSSKISFVQDV